MGAFTGSLNQNEIFSAIYNMIISQEVFADNIGGGYKLVDKARVDGGLLGDTKLYYATDALTTAAWGNDAEASGLLTLYRPSAPACQAITLNKFRQIRITVDNYLSKRAFADEGTFGSFMSVMLGWLKQTKAVYDETTYNAFIGTAVSATGKQSQTVSIPTISGVERKEESGVETEKFNYYDKEALARLEAEAIAEKIANILVDMKDVSKSYNDYGYLRSYDPSKVMVIWNAKYVNKIRKVDLPSLFHKDGLIEKFDEEILPARYFGTVNAAQKTADGTATRSLIEQVISTHHYFAGDLVTSGDVCPAGTSYQEDGDVICKMVVKLPPMMSAFEVGTSFFNPKSLTETHFLTFGHNTLEYFKNYPLVTLKAA